MTGFDKIRQTGFHGPLIERTVTRLNGGELPADCLFRLDTSFDDESVFRHLDYLGIGVGHLISLHLDEVEGGLRWVANTFPLRSVTSLEVAQMISTDQQNSGLEEAETSSVMLSLSFESTGSFDIDRVECDDSNCEFDHGYAGFMKQEGMTMHFTEEQTDEIASTPTEAMEFVGNLTVAMAAVK